MNLSENNLKLVTDLFLGKTDPFNDKDEDYKNLLMTYATDTNSSTLRELATMYYLGYESFTDKHGADGIDNKTGRLKEVKPVSMKDGKKRGTSGNFNDMTLELLEKKMNYDVICSLFNESRLVYIVEFPFSVIYEKIKKPIINASAGKRVVCHFNYLDYDCDDLVIHYLNNDLNVVHESLSKNHTKMLIRRKLG